MSFEGIYVGHQDGTYNFRQDSHLMITELLKIFRVQEITGDSVQ